jgi:hypothetical protein
MSSRGRKERTPAQLAVLAQAREKAKIVIAERAKINALQKTVVSVPVSEEVSPEPVSEEEAPHPEPEPEDPPPPPEPEAVSEESHPPPPPPPEPVSVSENEEPRLTRPKYHYINGMYIKIK